MQNYPNHGPLACRVCWPNCLGAHERSLDDDQFRLVNDPGYWGAPDPEVLVLGQTKGFTQSEGMARAIQVGGYDSVAFKDFRPRLLQAMKAIYMMQNFKNIDRFMMDGETTFGWASVIRCSMTGRSSSGEYSSKSSCVLPAYQAREAGAVISACMNTWLRRLSDRTVLVVLLGNADDYIASFRAKLATTFSDTRAHQRGPNVAHMADGRSWVHIGHPSGANGHFGDFLTGSELKGQGAKRIEAQKVVVHALRRRKNNHATLISSQE
ncbi:hypothetical protein ROG8370_03905 [Roseovarius gaetbuli]|uniref:Uracil DNA glycosylase superfamily protein n=2 Tax=Roseovarius gaetbuli TaxID=1356575 RepID=A0A1X7AD55_9RHOB|nr:hypothetical protein ROG8370_03905 [Roseovarius gaetbuli]